MFTGGDGKPSTVIAKFIKLKSKKTMLFEIIDLYTKKKKLKEALLPCKKRKK